MQWTMEPERRLMQAILEDAIACFKNYGGAPGKRQQELLRSAEEWVLAQDSSWLFSFGCICESLGLDPDSVRAQLLRLKEINSAAIPKAEGPDSSGATLGEKNLNGKSALLNQ